MLDFLQWPLIALIVVVAPIWIISHYVTRWRTAKTLSAEDEKMLAELWDMLPRIESRIAALEDILDQEDKTWRTVHERRQQSL